MKRSYKQNCALANAMDLVGERWTLLLVRELLTGAKRYGALATNLPGMGTNLLASRLKELMEAGLVEKSNQAYDLTEQGRLLEPVIHSLVRFGFAMDVVPRDDWLHMNDWDAVALKASYHPELDDGLDGRYEFDLDDTPFSIEKSGGFLDVRQEKPPHPRACVFLSKQAARDIAAGRMSATEAKGNGALIVSGDKQQAGMLMKAFGLF